MRAAVAVLLALPLLAGCLGATEPLSLPQKARLSPIPDWLLSQARFGILDGEDHYFESHDGTMLHASVFRPDAPEDWKAPVIVAMSPYHGSDAREDPLDPASRPSGTTYRWLLETFVPRGYALAFFDVRGTGDSGGCLEQTGWKEAMDGYVGVEYFAALPWSSGKVGMYGISYLGETQQATAIHAPPHLVTIVPAASVDDGYKWWFKGAVPYWDPWLSGETGYFLSDGAQVPLGPGLAEYPTKFGCHPSIAEHTVGDGTHDAFWDDLDLRPGVGNIKASVLYVHGLQDWNVKPDHVHDWFNLIPAEKHAVLGQWAHNYPWRNSFKSEWSRGDWNATVVRWFDHWLLGMANGVGDLPIVQVQDSEGAWRAETHWPPLDAQPVVFHLTPQGSLALSAPAGEGGRAYDEQFDRAQPYMVNDLPGQVVPLGLVPTVAPLPMPDGLRFESLEPLAAPLRFAGTPSVTLTVASSAPETHVAVRLLSIAANGTETLWDRGYLSAEHRLSLDQVDPLVPGQPYELSVEMYPQDSVIPAGERLALWIGPWDDWARPEGNDARVDVLMGPGKQGFLSIPAIARDLGVVGLPVPMYDWDPEG